MDRYLTVKEACGILQLSAYTMQEKLRNSEIRGSKVGNRWRIKEKDLEAYMKGCENFSSRSSLRIVSGGLRV